MVDMLQILKYEAVDKGVCIGYVDVKIDTWNLIIRRIAHLQKGERRWFNLPQYSIDGNEGKRLYVRYVDFDSIDTSSRFFEALKEAVRAYLEKNRQGSNKLVSATELAELFESEMAKPKPPLPPPAWEQELF